MYELRDDTTALSIMAIMDRKSEAYKDADLPADFILPAYTFKIMSRDERGKVVDTPYGPQPEHVKTAEGTIYLFANYFIVNENGQGAKCEFVGISPLNYTERSQSNWLKSLKTLDVIPEEGHSRYVHLSEEDQAKIGEKLQLIEDGKLVKRS